MLVAFVFSFIAFAFVLLWEVQNWEGEEDEGG